MLVGGDGKEGTFGLEMRKWEQGIRLTGGRTGGQSKQDSLNERNKM